MASINRIDQALTDAVTSILRAAHLDADEAYDDGLEAAEGYCDRDHCDDYSCNCRYGDDHAVDTVKLIVGDYLRKIRMGYTLDVTLQDVLEEMERSIEW